jgi:hypothetical protein
MIKTKEIAARRTRGKEFLIKNFLNSAISASLRCSLLHRISGGNIFTGEST